MKKIIILSAITLLITSCSKNEENDVPSISKDNIEIHQKTFDDAVGFLEKNASIGLQEAADYVKSLEGVTDVSITDSLIHVTTLGNVTFTLDFNSYPEFEDENIDVEELQQRIDDLDNTIEANIASGYEKTSDVFKEYIASNTHNEDNTYTANASTRASSVKIVRLSRRNVAIWNPWKDFSNETKRVDAVTHFINQEHPLQEFTSFTPTSFSAFKNFDLVYISSHGYKNGDIILPFDCLTQEELKLYNNELGSVGLYWEKDRGKKQYKGLLLTEKFFEKYLPDLSNTIIYTSACYLGVNNSSFLNSCLKKNVADYFASNDMCTCKHILQNFEEFYIYLLYGYSTNKSFADGKGYFIGSYVHNNKPCTYKYSRYGSKLVYYPTPHATGTGNRSNASRARTRGDGSAASSIVVNAQLRYATEETGDILNSIEAGICLQDMETKEVKLIPFSSKNIVSNEKKSYGNVTVSNIAVSLDDLTDEHKYAYCCYTKVDGQITLSDECYPISDNYYLRIHYKQHEISRHYYTKIWYMDGTINEEDYDLGPDDDDSERDFTIAKINGKYYIHEISLPQQLYADNSLVEYPYIPSGLDDGYDGHGKAQCMMDNNTIHLNWSYTWKEPSYFNYLKGYTVSSFEQGIEINNLDSDLTASWTDRIFTTEDSYQWQNGDKEYRKIIYIAIRTFLYFEKSDIPSEDLLNWEKLKENWCELVNGTKKQAK